MSWVVKNKFDVYDEYVYLELKFDSDLTNININKVYNIRAYIGSSQTTLLLGQGNNILRDLFDSGYCISYNFYRGDYEAKRERAMKRFEIHKNFIEDVNKFVIDENYIALITYYNSKKVMMDELLNLSLSLDYMTTIEDYSVVDELYNKSEKTLSKLKEVKEKIDGANIQKDYIVENLNNLIALYEKYYE